MKKLLPFLLLITPSILLAQFDSLSANFFSQAPVGAYEMLSTNMFPSDTDIVITNTALYMGLTVSSERRALAWDETPFIKWTCRGVRTQETYTALGSYIPANTSYWFTIHLPAFSQFSEDGMEVHIQPLLCTSNVVGIVTNFISRQRFIPQYIRTQPSF
jgi:hypothetical protein